MLVEEHHCSVLYRSEYIRTSRRILDCSPPGSSSSYSTCPSLAPTSSVVTGSSRSQGTWARKPWLVPLAPQGWLQQLAQHQPSLPPPDPQVRSSYPPVCSSESRPAWARLLVKVYEVDALRCSRCGSPMKVLAVITDPPQVRRILLHLIKTGLARRAFGFPLSADLSRCSSPRSEADPCPLPSRWCAPAQYGMADPCRARGDTNWGGDFGWSWEYGRRR